MKVRLIFYSTIITILWNQMTILFLQLSSYKDKNGYITDDESDRVYYWLSLFYNASISGICAQRLTFDTYELYPRDFDSKTYYGSCVRLVKDIK